MKKDEAINYDPWQKLAKSGQVKKVELDEALDKLKVSEEEAPADKREMLNQVRKIVKPKDKKA